MNKIIWLTGHSGAGKTSVAKEILKITPCVILDGDDMRKSISLNAGFSREDRENHNLKVARLAKILSQHNLVVVSVIAPMKSTREKINKICSPFWVFIKRTLPKRDEHFYEKSLDYFTIDHDKFTARDSAEKILYQYKNNKKYSLFIGRFQPLHQGHIKLIRTVLDEGKNVCIGLRDTPISETDPYDKFQRITMFEKNFEIEIASGKMKVWLIPDIEEVCYGRNVGWGIRQIKLDEKTEAISATQIRNEQRGQK